MTYELNVPQAAMDAYAEEIFSQVLPMLTSAWGTEVWPLPEDMVVPYMRLVVLPPMADFPPIGVS